MTKTKEKYVTYTVFTRALETLTKRIDSLSTTVATKDDLKGFATKDDLKGFATKDDIANLAIRIVTMEGEIKYLKETSSTKDDIRRLTDHIDAFAKKSEVHFRKALVHDYRLNQLEPKVDNHEIRLSRLESKANLR